MNEVWAVHLPIDKASAAAPLRLWPGLEMRMEADGLWLRGAEMTDALNLELRKLPGGRRFSVDADGTLTADGSRLPSGKLVGEGWQSLASFFVPSPQPAALSGMPSARVKLSLVRTEDETPATVLLTSWEPWYAYAISAPAIRLKPLGFAVADGGRTLVRGAPLPPLAGRRFVETMGIAIPCGWQISPTIDASTVVGVLGIAQGDVALFNEDGTWEWIPGEDFIPANRASVRATREPLRLQPAR